MMFPFDHRYLGSLALCRASGRVLLGLKLALFEFDIGSGGMRLITQVEPVDRDNRLNDGRCDAAGRFWVGTMDNPLHRPHGTLYRVDPDGRTTPMADQVIVSNTVTLSPAQDRLYFSDTRRYTTWQFDLDIGRGSLSNRRIFIDHGASSSRPDGACVDAQGFIWTAIFAEGRVVRYSPAGLIEREIRLPVTNPTCVCLGGPELRTLFITTARKFLDRRTLRQEPLAGSLLAVEVDVPGLPEHRFGSPQAY